MRGERAVECTVELQPTLTWLEPRHRGAIAAHLRRLDGRERLRRFGRAMSDCEIAAFAEMLDFATHWLLGAFSFDQRLIGLVHACPVHAGRDCTIYAAISVELDHRGRGLGRALLGAVVDRLHQVAATSVVAIGSCFELRQDDLRGEFGDFATHAYEMCTGIRIEAERMPAGRSSRRISRVRLDFPRSRVRVDFHGQA